MYWRNVYLKLPNPSVLYLFLLLILNFRKLNLMLPVKNRKYSLLGSLFLLPCCRFLILCPFFDRALSSGGPGQLPFPWFDICQSGWSHLPYRVPRKTQFGQDCWGNSEKLSFTFKWTQSGEFYFLLLEWVARYSLISDTLPLCNLG